jgi:hypothetical protein
MRTPQKRDIQKYCEYHNDHGHWTEDCTTVRKEIEIFIQNGKLIKFLADEKGRDNHPRGNQLQGMESQSNFTILGIL